eukprot:augustus_masked-scaffold_37-processed-gene-2.23-mRNA-1 protein AED:1.00 eAED:1.00 QI:0/-1/0/0/-1/1/1/0/407
MQVIKTECEDLIHFSRFLVPETPTAEVHIGESKKECELKKEVSANSELVSADFKPYSEWTKKDKREYTARALRQHRRKQKEDRLRFVESTRKLEDDVDKLRAHHYKLKMLKSFLEKQNTANSNLWTQSFLLNQNECLRKQAVKLRLFQTLIFHSQRLKTCYPDTDSTDIFRCMQSAISELFINFYYFNKRTNFNINNRKVEFVRNTKKLKSEINSVTAKAQKVKAKMNVLALDKFSNYFLHFCQVVEGIPFEKFVDLNWYIFTEKRYKNMFTMRYRLEQITTMQYDNNEVFFEQFSGKIPIRARKLRIVKYTDRVTDEVYFGCNVFHFEEKKAALSSFKIVLNPVKNKFEVTEEVALTTFKDISERKPRIQIRFNCVNKEPMKRVSESVPFFQEIAKMYLSSLPHEV